MESIKLWDCNLSQNYEVFTNTNDFFAYIIKNNKNFSFTLSDGYKLGDETKNTIDSIAERSAVSITYTDSEHPIIYPKDNPHYTPFVNPDFFNEHKKEFIEFARRKLEDDIEKEDLVINIYDYSLTEEEIDVVTSIPGACEKMFYYKTIEGKEISQDFKEKLKNKFIDFNIIRCGNSEKVGSRYVLEHYTLDALKKAEEITISLPIEQEKFKNFKYVNENTIIKIHSNSSMNEEEKFKNLKELVNSLDNERKYNFKMTVENRHLFRKTGLMDALNHDNFNVVIENDLEEYFLNDYIKEEEKLDKMIEPILEQNLSPLEKYIAIYNKVKNFKPYKENYEDKEQSRKLRYLLDENNEYMVCVGYSELLKTLLERVEIPCYDLSVRVDISYDDGFSVEEKSSELAGHARNIVKIDDEKYGVHGVYVADATWDNSINHDLYSNALMTFDRKKEARRLESLTKEDLLLDFHSFEEFNTKVNYLLKLEERNKFNAKKTVSAKTAEAYCKIMKQILEIMKDIDYKKYKNYNYKYQSIIGKYGVSLEEIEPIAVELLNEYAEYIVPLSNNEVDMENILAAASIVKTKVEGLSEEEMHEWITNATNSRDKASKVSFPYQYDPTIDKEGYVEARTR